MDKKITKFNCFYARKTKIFIIFVFYRYPVERERGIEGIEFMT